MEKQSIEWKVLKLNIQNVIYETEKAILIRIPKTDWDFWHPKKLVRRGSHSYEIAISYHDGFEFKAKRTSKKTHSVLGECTFSASELEVEFSGTNPQFRAKSQEVE